MKTFLAILSMALWGGICFADPTPIHLAVEHDRTPVTTVLASLSTQAGVPILADDTVVDLLGLTTIDKPGLEPMLDQLDTLVPGLTWQRVYLPQKTETPSANTLSLQVRTLKALAASGITLAEPTTQNTVSAERKPLGASAAAPEGMKTVYLVTNEAVRAKREAGTTGEGDVSITRAMSGLQTATDIFGRMTADQQREAMPQMFMQFQQMMRGIDPGLRDQMRQQFQQRRQRGQGQGGAAPAPTGQ